MLKNKNFVGYWNSSVTFSTVSDIECGIYNTLSQKFGVSLDPSQRDCLILSPDLDNYNTHLAKIKLFSSLSLDKHKLPT